ncbi:MAG: outer membrane beta-barrel protein [Saprospiraceae bacterium]
MARLLVFIIFLTFSFSGNAQLRIHAGGGVNFSNIDFKNFQTPKVNSATNYFISVRPELGITESISVGLDIQYSRKGYNFDDANADPISGYRFQYLDLIPQAQLKVFKPLYLFGGIGLGIRTSERFKIEEIWDQAKIKLTKPTEFTYVAGMRFYPVKKISIHAQFAGTLGQFFDVEWTDAQGNIIPNVSTKLNNIQVGLGYQLY